MTQDCIYLTNAQIETLFKLSLRGRTQVGVQLRGNASATSAVVCDAVIEGDLAHTVIDADGKACDWEF